MSHVAQGYFYRKMEEWYRATMTHNLPGGHGKNAQKKLPRDGGVVPREAHNLQTPVRVRIPQQM